MPRVPIPLDRGLDRASGQLVVDPASAIELRDFVARDGKLELRPGTGDAIATASEGDAVCWQHVFRAKACIVLVLYDRASRDITVVRRDLNGLNSQTIGVFGTLAAGAIEPPRFFISESFSFLTITHDEPLVTRRLKSRYTDGTTLTDLDANLDTTGVKDTLFRGTEEYLGYSFLWGFGADNDKARGEVVRTSRPSDPRTIDAQLAFQAGPRDEAIVRAIPCDAGLLLCKEVRTYLLAGRDYASFGVLPRDESRGLASGRLAVKVGGWVYGWSHAGPGRTNSGFWEDLALPLELRNELGPDFPLRVDISHGHAHYWADRQLVSFWFPDLANDETLVFLLSLEAGSLRWSHMTLPLAVLSLANVSDSLESVAVDPGQSSATSHGGVQIGTSFLTKVTVTHDTPVGDETIEFWGRQGAAAYTKLTQAAINTSAATQTFTINVPAAGSWDLAVRYVRLGAPRADHSGDPATWPAGALATGTVTALPTLTASSLVFTPGATIAGSTWGLSWNAPIGGAFARVSMLAYNNGPIDAVFNNTDVISLVGTYHPVPSSQGYTSVYDAPVGATSVSGRSTLINTTQVAGAIVSLKVTQHLTVNGLAGSSVPSTAIELPSLRWGLAEVPGPAGTPYTGIYRVPTVPGTQLTARWVNSASVASASTKKTEVCFQFKTPANNGFYSIRDEVVSTSEQHSIQVPAGTPPTCGEVGEGNTVQAVAYARHRLIIAGVEQYTGWRHLGLESGVCTL